ncbi:hypothetical protein [Streptomyces sp. NPDC056105]
MLFELEDLGNIWGVDMSKVRPRPADLDRKTTPWMALGTMVYPDV